MDTLGSSMEACHCFLNHQLYKTKGKSYYRCEYDERGVISVAEGAFCTADEQQLSFRLGEYLLHDVMSGDPSHDEPAKRRGNHGQRPKMSFVASCSPLEPPSARVSWNAARRECLSV